jgi:hypothetical protein
MLLTEFMLIGSKQMIKNISNSQRNVKIENESIKQVYESKTLGVTIGGFKVSDAIGSGGANTLGRARGQRHFPYYFLLGVGKLRLHNLLNF